MKQLEKYIRNVLSESAKINFAGHKFVLKVDTNEDPQKKGVKVQFLPTEFGSITATEQNDIAIELETNLIFYGAEDYHQDYLDKNANGYCHVRLDSYKNVE